MKIENRQRFLLILTVVAAGLYMADLAVFEPLAGWWSARSARIAVLRKQVNEGQQLLERDRGLRSRWDRIRTNSLPADPSLAEQRVLKSIDSWARESGAEIVDRIPQWKGDADDHQTLNCRIEATGSLSSLTQLLYKIEKGPMTLKLDSLQLGSRDNSGQLLTLGIQVNGLVLAAPNKP